MASSGLKGLLDWAKHQVAGYPGVDVTNFTSSWRDGLAFCAIIHKYRPDLIDFHALNRENVRENNELAFRVAEEELSIPALLEADDMVRMRVPDRLSVATYVSQYHNNLFKLKPAGGPDVRAYSPSKDLKRPLSRDEDEAPEMRRKPLQERPQPAARQSVGDVCAHCGSKVYLLERHLINNKLYHRVCYRRITNSLGKSPLKNYENSLLGAQDRLGSPVVNQSPSSEAGSDRGSDRGSEGPEPRPRSKRNSLEPGAKNRNSFEKGEEPKAKLSSGLPSWFKKGEKKNKNVNEELPNNRMRLSDENADSRSAKLKENAVFNDLGVASSMNNTSSGEIDTDSSDTSHSTNKSVFSKVPNVSSRKSPKTAKKKDKKFLDFRSMSNDSVLGKKNTNVLRKEQNVTDKTDGPLSARARASAHWSTTSLDASSSQQSLTSRQSSDNVRSPLSHIPSTNSESVQSFVPISALISTPIPYAGAETADEPETPQDLNENTAPDTDKTVEKAPIPVQPHFDTFDQVVDTPEREVKISQAKSNTYVPDTDSKVREDKLPWFAEKDQRDGSRTDSRSATDVSVTSDSTTPSPAPTISTPEVTSHPSDVTSDYPEDLNPFAGDEDEEEEETKPAPSGFANAQTAFKSSTVRSIRTVAGSPRKKRAAPTLPGNARLSLRTEAGEVRNQPGDRASLPPASVDRLSPRASPRTERSASSASSSPRREKRPAPRPPVATPRVSLLNKPDSEHIKTNSEVKDVKNITNDLVNNGDNRPAENHDYEPIEVPKTTPNSLPLNQGQGTLKKVKVSRDFDFTRASMDSDRDSPTHAGSETEELLNQIDLSADSPMTPENPIATILEGKKKTPSKKLAPPQPAPKRKINLSQKLPTFEIEKELIGIESTLEDLEARGRCMEDSIRLAEEEAGWEDDDDIVRWFELVNEKNALVRREQELTYILREQDLEEDHEDIEFELRQLMAIQESQKTEADRAREAELLEKLLQIVNERNIIVHNIDDDRIRYEEEDRVIAATLAQSFSKQTLTSCSTKSSDSPSASPKPKKKDKKEKKEKKKKGGIFSCVTSRKTSATFYDKPTDKPSDKPEEEPKAVSARKVGSTFYRDTEDVKI